MTDTRFAPIAEQVRGVLASQGFMQLVGADVAAVAPGEVVLTLDRRPEVLQQHGFFHGGAIAFLVDNATTAAAGTLIDRATQAVLTAEYKLNFVAPAAGERLTCRATVLKPGRSLTIVEAKVTCGDRDADGKLVAVALATIAGIARERVA